MFRFGALALLTVAVSYSAELKPETLAAWDGYLQQERLHIEKRANEGPGFLWVDAAAERLGQLRSGAVLVEPISSQTPVRVPGGLIHHWIGAAFIPHASVEDVIAITRDYSRYKDYYKPTVEDAIPVSSSDNQDEFIILLANNSLLSKTSLEGDYICEYKRVSDKRSYSVSHTKQMQEVKGFGQPGEKRLPLNHGAGYIWRLYSTTRLEERDGGVVVELEAIALSRDVPGSLRWLVDPIIRRVSRSSLEKSLAETAVAVEDRARNFALNSR